MAKAEAEEDEAAAAGAPKARSRLPLIVGLALMPLLGGAGFVLARGNLLAALEGTPAAVPGPTPDVAFVPIDPLVISIGPGANGLHLRFAADLEVAKPQASKVAGLMPRILDVLNGYLRAVDTHELENPVALIRLRAQMLRRVQIVTGEGRVRDLLITQFVLN